MSVWKILSDDGPLWAHCGTRIYGDEPPPVVTRPYVWVDINESGCTALGPGDARTYTVVIKGRAASKLAANLIMASVLGALADARPLEYIQHEGYYLVGGVGVTGAVGQEGEIAGLRVAAVLNVAPVSGAGIQ